MFFDKRKKGWRKYFSPLRLALGLISLVFLWGVFLFSTTQFNDTRAALKESDRLKNQIIELSKKYIHKLAEERGKTGKGSTLCSFSFFNLAQEHGLKIM